MITSVEFYSEYDKFTLNVIDDENNPERKCLVIGDNRTDCITCGYLFTISGEAIYSEPGFTRKLQIRRTFDTMETIKDLR